MFVLGRGLQYSAVRLRPGPPLSFRYESASVVVLGTTFRGRASLQECARAFARAFAPARARACVRTCARVWVSACVRFVNLARVAKAVRKGPVESVGVDGAMSVHSGRGGRGGGLFAACLRALVSGLSIAVRRFALRARR